MMLRPGRPETFHSRFLLYVPRIRTILLNRFNVRFVDYLTARLVNDANEISQWFAGVAFALYRMTAACLHRTRYIGMLHLYEHRRVEYYQQGKVYLDGSAVSSDRMPID